MKRLTKWIAVLAALVMCLACCSCGGSKGGGKYLDTVERPEIETPEPSDRVQYPQKPATAPSAPAAGAVPTVSGYAPSQAASPYTVTDTDAGKRISYTDVSDWAYVYVSVQDYSAAYGNFKITLNNDPEGRGSNAAIAERIAVQAVYYEAYDLGYAPVTVYSGELTAGAQYVIAEMGETLITDKTYQAVAGESVRDKTILGFVIFIDSLPLFSPANDAAGTVDIVNFVFLQDGDPALEDRYIKPVAVLEDAAAAEDDEDSVQCDYADETLTLSGSGTVYVPLTKYSEDFTIFDLTATGASGESVRVGVRYTLGDKTETALAAPTPLTGEEQTIRFDYTDLRPQTGEDEFDARLIKYGTLTDIVLVLDNVSELSVVSVAFTRTAASGAYIADSWTSNSSSVRILWSYGGGNAGIALEYHIAYNYLSVPIRKGDGIRGIALTLYAPDGIDHLGLGIVTNSPHCSESQTKGTFILRNAKDVVKGNASTASTTLPKEPYMQGVTETIVYDEPSKTYTITYDFSSMTADDNERTFADYTITALLMYMNCTDGVHTFDGSRALYFMDIRLM